MRKLRDLFVAKMIAIMLLTTCVIGIPCLAYQTLYNFYQRETVIDIFDFGNYSYLESNEFSNDVNLRLMQLTDYLRLKEILETNGELDYNKVAAKVYGPNGIEEYTINDLIKYNVANYGFYPEQANLGSLFEEENARVVLDSTKRVVYPILISEEGKAEVGGVRERVTFVANFTKEENQVFVDLDEACRYYQALWDQQIAESEEVETDSIESNRTEIAEFLDSISDKLEKTNNTIENTKKLAWIDSSEEVQINLLSDVAYCMTFYVSFYQQYKAIFEQEVFSEQDLLYWISDGNQTIATNMQDKLPKEDALGKIKYQYPSMGEIWYQTENHLMEATMQADRGIIAELEELFLERSGGNISIYIVIPQDHTGLFEEQREQSEHNYHSIPMYIGYMIVLGIVAIISIYFLFCSAGHRTGYNGIYLDWFDRWYTEIAAGVCIGLGMFFLMMFFEVLWGRYGIENLIILGLLGLGMYIVALISFSSLAKRIKAGTFWKNSLTCKVFKDIKKYSERIAYAFLQIWENRSTGKKIAFIFICIIIGHSIVPIVLLFFLEAIDYGRLEIALPCFAILVAVLVTDFKILQRLIQQKAELVEIYKGTERISSREWNYKLEESSFHGILQQMAGAVNRVGDGLNSAIEQSVRDERMKTDLITNVSHDIKTPLTSIINYIDLLKREQFEDEKVRSYLEILDQKSQRLKNLIDDLIEASKLSSETVVLSIEKIDLVELVRQTNGEFAEKFAEKNLTIIPSLPEKPIIIEADGRGLWRVLENLYINVSKYAMEHTRVYVSVLEKTGSVVFSIKNISDSPLNIDASELTERFIRGDVSRSTEGSGLGLSIAKSLTELMHGKFEIYLDGDLFRVTIIFNMQTQDVSLVQEAVGM